MFKKILSFALIVLMLNAIGASFAYAAETKEEKEARFAEKVKAEIHKLGTGTEARVEVKLRDKTKLKGYISAAGEDSFVVIDEKTGTATTVPYPQAKQVKGNNLSKGVKIAIGIGIVALPIIIVLIVLSQDKS